MLFQPLEAIIGTVKGGTAYVWGTSASRLECPEFHPAIGVNNILVTATTHPEYLLIVDHTTYQHEKARILNYKGVLLLWRRLAEQIADTMYAPKRCVTFRLRPLKAWSERVRDFLHWGFNTGHYAAQVLALMGYTKIVLLGIDLFWPKDGPSHDFGRGVTMHCKPPDKKFLKIYLDEYKRLRYWLKDEGVELVTSSPWSGPLKDMLPYEPCSGREQGPVRESAPGQRHVQKDV